MDLFAPQTYPRNTFGQRSDTERWDGSDPVLDLRDAGVGAPHRLMLLAASGETVGEVYLTDGQRRLPLVYEQREFEAPYFPGDLGEDEAPRLANPLPLRGPPPASPSTAVSDILTMLAVALAREHETVMDQLMQFYTHEGWSPQDALTLDTLTLDPLTLDPLTLDTGAYRTDPTRRSSEPIPLRGRR